MWISYNLQTEPNDKKHYLIEAAASGIWSSPFICEDGHELKRSQLIKRMIYIVIPIRGTLFLRSWFRLTTLPLWNVNMAVSVREFRSSRLFCNLYTRRLKRGFISRLVRSDYFDWIHFCWEGLDIQILSEIRVISDGERIINLDHLRSPKNLFMWIADILFSNRQIKICLLTNNY